MELAPGLRRIARITWWVGLPLLLVGVILIILQLTLPGGLLTGIGLIAIGANALIGGEIINSPESRVYAAKGPVVNGRIDVRSGPNSFKLMHGSRDQIANMRYGPYGQPRFEERDGIAYIEYRRSALRPGIHNWGAEVATNILWEIEAKSGLGDLDLDLTELRIETLTARTGMGHLTVRAPERGYARLNLRTGIGKVMLRLPELTGARIILKRGGLASLELKNPRLRLYGPDRYGTPDFEEAAARVEVLIETRSGDIVLA